MKINLLFLFIFGLFFFFNSYSKEYYQNFANATLWPFNRILQPIHYWLAQFSPSYYPNLYFPNWIGYYHRPAGPWFQSTQW